VTTRSDRMPVFIGELTLVKAGITNEAEAEKLARGTSGDPVPRNYRPR
jgi:hypothetical protein